MSGEWWCVEAVVVSGEWSEWCEWRAAVVVGGGCAAAAAACANSAYRNSPVRVRTVLCVRGACLWTYVQTCTHKHLSGYVRRIEATQRFSRLGERSNNLNPGRWV